MTPSPLTHGSSMLPATPPLDVFLHHVTRYRFDRDTRLGPHLIRLHPACHCPVPVTAYRLEVSGVPCQLHWQMDPMANRVARVSFAEPTRELTLTVSLNARLEARNPFDFLLDPEATRLPLNYGADLSRELAPCLAPDAAGPALTAYLREIPDQAEDSLGWLVALNRRLAADIAYECRPEPGVQTAEETMLRCRGSCRDSAWLLVQLLRCRGLAARFVSGYLVEHQPGEEDGGPRSSELHAWAEAYLPGAGWVGLDPTSGLLTDAHHIPLASAAVAANTAPVSGSTSPCSVHLEHELRVSPLPLADTPLVMQQGMGV